MTYCDVTWRLHKKLSILCLLSLWSKPLLGINCAYKNIKALMCAYSIDHHFRLFLLFQTFLFFKKSEIRLFVFRISRTFNAKKCHSTQNVYLRGKKNWQSKIYICILFSWHGSNKSQVLSSQARNFLGPWLQGVTWD